jgi:putative N6-adenine-specific DNA methylase
MSSGPPLEERIFAACNPGFEPVLARELAGLGLDARAVPGGAEAHGPDAIALACLGSRAADAVSLRLHQGEPSGVDGALREARRRFGREADLAVRRHTGEVTLSIDAAGGPLYKRGWRQRIGAAPLRETVAAAMLLSCGYDGSVPFLDPMCGSGTLAIEAALIAGRRAPGLGRTFAFESWPGHDPARTEALRKRFAAQERKPPQPVHASDRNGGALRLAGKNAEAARVAPFVRFERMDAGQVMPPDGPGICAVNPPYGERLTEEVDEAWRALGSLSVKLGGWTLCVLAPEKLVGSLPERPNAVKTRVRNGGIACVVWRARV